MARQQSDKRARFYGPILDALRELGGSATPREVKDIVLDRVSLSAEELSKTRKNGSSAVENDIAWARNDLRERGLIDPSIHGVWRLTEDGEKTYLTSEESQKLSSVLQPPLKISREVEADSLVSEVFVEYVASDESGETDLLSVISSLPPAGFERLCQRLLRESGFSEVHVTGKSGDGGIDGHGILRINALVSFRVLFQCKRYQGTVGPNYIRDFRGAMTGRTDKGIILTTGSFTRDAEREAVREGAPEIELVDGERLVELMQRLLLGVRPRTVFDVDEKFFEEYRR